MDKPIKISIEGNISCGKQIFIKHLKKKFNQEFVCVQPNVKIERCEENINDLFYTNTDIYYSLNSWTNISNICEFYKKRHNTYMITSRSVDTHLNVLLYASYDTNLIDNFTFKSVHKCISTTKDLIDNTYGVLDCVIYIRIDPNDLYAFLITNGIYDSLNFKLIHNIHKKYEEYIELLKSSSVNVITLNLDSTLLNDLYFSTKKSIFKEVDNQLRELYPSLYLDS